MLLFFNRSKLARWASFKKNFLQFKEQEGEKMMMSEVYKHVLGEKGRSECPENAKAGDIGYGKLWILRKVLSRLNWGRFGKTEKEIKQELQNIKQIVDNTPASEDFKKGAYFMLAKISGYFTLVIGF